MATADLPSLPPLVEDVQADVCVVGGGIAGLTTAYLLTREGRSVVLLDAGPLAGGNTARTTAHLSNAIDDRYARIEQLHGREAARLAADSHSQAIAQIESTVEREAIDCDFERLDGYLLLAPGDSRGVLDQELGAAHRAGLFRVERVAKAPIETFDTLPCLRFPEQRQFHPLKYLAGLARAIRREGGRLFASTRARQIEGGPEAYVATEGGSLVRAGAVVVATNTPVNDRFAIHTKQAPYLTYVIGAQVPRGSVPKALYWDTADPYHYVRLQRSEASPELELLLVGGEDHKTGQAGGASERFDRLETWAKKHFPTMQDVVYRWSGQVMETIDGLAFIGRNPGDEPNVLVATGDSGMGMTHGTIAGMLIRDLILGRDNPWEELYRPTRKTTRAAADFARENLNVAGRYFAWLAPGEAGSLERLVPDSGAVLRRGLRKVAAYRDSDGTLHLLSARCRHLGCVVRWNAFEHTWDCPCHGSRYDGRGSVFNGPANSDLAPFDD